MGGESSNHSGVDFAHPDAVEHPLFAGAEKHVTTLRAGDALFIPEGFWHPVDSEADGASDGLTLAINYW